MSIYEQILAMPKIDLHLHLDGAVKGKTILELAQKTDIELPAQDIKTLMRYLQVTEDCKSLVEYLEKFDLPLAVMQTREGLERVAYELCETLKEENVRYFEVRFAPQLHTQRGLNLNEIVKATLDGLNEGRIEFGIKTGLILCAMRHHPVELNLEVVDIAAEYQDRGVVAIDLAGDEAGFPVEGHAEVLKKAKEKGLHITVHAGEAMGAESVAKSLELGAERIGHGVRSYEDESVLEILKAKKILLEVCPKSNYHTKAVKSLKEHPVKKYFDLGLRVCINTDNPTVSNTSITEEYFLAVKELGFTCDDLKRTVIYAAEGSFLPEDEKETLLTEIKEEMDKIK